MRKALIIGFFVAFGVALGVACDSTNTNPIGPSTVVIETPSPPTTTVLTTTTTPPTTTTIPLATTRTYVAFGQVAPTTPIQLTIALQATGPLSWIVTGSYRTAGGGSGQVSGTLTGTLDTGAFNGLLTSETPECTAERAFSGTVDTQFLRWNGGATLADCKGSPLAFNELVMLPTGAPPPVSTVNSTSTIPVQCSYALSSSSVSVPTSGGQATVGLTTGPTCGWTVQNFVPWITVLPAGGTGSATIALTVAAGPPRSATLVIGGVVFVVNQVAPTSAAAPLARGLN